MSKTTLTVFGFILLALGAGVGFAIASLSPSSRIAKEESAQVRAELVDVQAQLEHVTKDAESARTELSKFKSEADLKWAREVAELFLNAVGEGEDGLAKAIAVCTKECRARQMGFAGYMVFVPDTFGKLTWTISSHQASEPRDRVSYRGTLRQVRNDVDWRTRGFQLLLVKEKNGDWIVSEFGLGPGEGR